MPEYTETVGSRKSLEKAWEADADYLSAWHSDVGAHPKLYGNLRSVRSSEKPCIASQRAPAKATASRAPAAKPSRASRLPNTQLQAPLSTPASTSLSLEKQQT